MEPNPLTLHQELRLRQFTTDIENLTNEQLKTLAVEMYTLSLKKDNAVSRILGDKLLAEIPLSDMG
jgi:hypothetical protein